MYERGIGVVVSSYKQSVGDPTFGNKTGCYFPRILARQEAHRKGGQEALWYTPDKRLAEGCFTNVFLVLDGTVLTPPRDTPVLPGITRAAVLELCRQLDIPCQDEQDLYVQQMLAAEEIFLTASTMGIVPVARIERHAVGDERRGPITKRLMDAYNDLLREETLS
jgi:branched-subunit amino acid aminotransferase/4-amino-4-deoxychorismate lyase